MRKSVACVFALAIVLAGCSDEDIQGGAPFPFGPDNPMNVSGTWTYEGRVVEDACSTLFCGECHHARTGDSECDPWYECIQGVRTIVQDRDDLNISDHIIDSAMGVEMQGSVRVYSGSFSCGRSVVDESGTTLLYTEDGTFHSNDSYSSTLSLSSSGNGATCKVIWSVAGRRAD